jgi:hypothetical protein
MFSRKKEEVPDKAIVTVPAKGSLQATGKNETIALLQAKLLLICDRSASMAEQDAMHGKARYEVEDGVVLDLQSEHPGQIVIEAFAESAIVCLDGNLPYPNGGATYIGNALKFAEKLMKNGMRAILITDGEASDDESAVLRAAEALRGRLDVIYVGPDRGVGRKFLQNIASAANGTFQKNKLDNPKMLHDAVETLLLQAGKK